MSSKFENLGHHDVHFIFGMLLFSLIEDHVIGNLK